ncbi:hypothetical protein HOV23_gp128 [Pseudomonas phage Lana]|uniref:Uncharacterized protein n=1 Tax=Pseudomonas phage Lana TaxID=2530172 RepID=A0A481W655_9CAUD|nr:hypothetical protein HOV23_gp128 [Pseudomonas phage Lana]QBJ04445.1 hypothetical protein [Pseudomonas phage Lana]
MEVQDTVVAAAYWLWNWTATLQTPHFIAMAVCYAAGSLLGGRRHVAAN